MPQDLEQIVQRMIDAGESEADIAAVIQEMKTSPAEPDEGGIPTWMKAAGAGAAGLGVLALTRNSGAAAKVGKSVLDLRRLSMLSGLAPLKSTLGNIGGAAYSSIERGSMAPLKEMLSMQTARDFGRAFKTGVNQTANGPGEGLSKWNLPGRYMGAMDEASQNALQRAGMTAEESAREMLQAPVRGQMMEAMRDNPVADYLVPFRRTPMNQMIEGIGSFKPSNLQTTGQKVAFGTSVATGAATGALAEDPKTIALGTAFSGRRALPFAAGAAAARMLRTGSKREGADALQGMTPISDYSLQEGILEPTKIIPKPAAVGAYDYLRKMLGL